MNGTMNILAQAAGTADKLPWYENPNILAIIAFLVAIPLAVFVGRRLGKSFRLQEVSGKISLILLCILVSIIVFWAKSANTYLETNGRTSMPFKFGVDLRGGVTIIGQMNDQKLEPGETEITIHDIIPRLKDRIDPSGVREIVIRALGRYKMEVIIPDVEKEEAERIWQRLITAGQLVFRIVADENKDTLLVQRGRDTAHERLPDVFGMPDTENPIGKKLGEWFSLAREQADDPTSKELMPFKFLPGGNHLARDGQTGEIIDMSTLPLDGGDYELARGQFNEWTKERGIVDVQILMVHPPDDRQNVEGKYLTSVRQGFDQSANLRIEFNLNSAGGKRMWALTSRNQRDGDRFRLLGIVLDEKLHAAPRINEPIRDNGVIEGNFNREEIQSYIAVLSSGKLDVALRKNWISMDQILSTLGEELKRKGLLAISISLGLVLVFMVFYYRFCGIVACFALILNLVFVMTILLMINVNLTLTGLAGLVLTIGMSVDANVLIFERIREELTRGSALRMAIRNGFDRATTTIVDANLTTLITAVILYVIGSEQIRSFAVTLIVGILMCMFTSIFCSRVFFDVAERKRWITQLNMRRIALPGLLDIIGKRQIAFVISFLVIATGLVAFFIRGWGMLDTDLAGGSTARVEFVQATSVDELQASLEAADEQYDGDPIRYSVTQMADNSNAFKIDSSLPVIEDPDAPSQITLDEIIASVFQDQLVMLDMDYDPNQIQISQLPVRGPPAGQTPSGGNSGAATPANQRNPAVEGPSSIPTGSDQSPPASEDDNQDGKKQNDGKQDDGKQDDGKPGNPKLSLHSAGHLMSAVTLSAGLLIQENDPQKQESEAGKSTPEKTGTQEPATQEPPVGDPNAPDPNTSNPDPTAQGTTPPTGRQKYDASVRLTFRHPITGLSVKGYLMDAARELQPPVSLREDEIRLRASDLTLDVGDRSQEWDVTLTILDQNDPQRLLDQVKSKMSSEPYFASSSGVGSQVAGETQRKAIYAIIASLIGIVAYVWVRFQNVAFGLAAIVALVHDVLVVLGAIAISYWLSGVFGFLLVQDFRISLSVIAALMTIIGYSLNDTIVVFDRIREVRGKRSDLTAEIINKSISQTLSRTILTSLTTFMVVFILYLIGGDSIHAFAFSLVIGVIVGTYSSIFVASPALLWLMNRGVSASEEPAKTG